MMATLRYLVYAMTVLLSVNVWANDEGYVRDFKAVDTALVNHPTTFTGNPDVDYRKELIRRRENIINMSEVAMARSNDPATAALAQQIIAKQKRDIADLQSWLEAHQ